MSRIAQALRSDSPDGQRAPGDPRGTKLDAYPTLAPVERQAPGERRAPEQFTEPQDPASMEGRANFSETLIVNEQAPRICTEQFRGLAAGLHNRQSELGLRTLMVTSPHANEGKTFTAANLGLMLSESYRRRVLIIDADLRRPCLHAVFNLSNADGLSDGLKEHARQPAKVTAVTEWLAILPGGTPQADPMPILTSGRLPPILREAASKFDWVIIDTPPVALLPDASLVGSMVDAVILVVSAGVAPHRLVHRAVEALGRNKIFGVILNRVDRRTLPEASYEHYYGQKTMSGERRTGLFSWGDSPARR